MTRAMRLLMADSNTLAAPLPEKSPKTRPVQSRAATEIKELQRLMMADARAGARNNVLPQLARAYVDCQEMRLRLAMKPAPKPIDVSLKPRKSRKSQDYADSPVDPTTPPPAK